MRHGRIWNGDRNGGKKAEHLADRSVRQKPRDPPQGVRLVRHQVRLLRADVGRGAQKDRADGVHAKLFKRKFYAKIDGAILLRRLQHVLGGQVCEGRMQTLRTRGHRRGPVRRVRQAVHAGGAGGPVLRHLQRLPHPENDRAPLPRFA